MATTYYKQAGGPDAAPVPVRALLRVQGQRTFSANGTALVERENYLKFVDVAAAQQTASYRGVIVLVTLPGAGVIYAEVGQELFSCPDHQFLGYHGLHIYDTANFCRALGTRPAQPS